MYKLTLHGTESNVCLLSLTKSAEVVHAFKVNDCILNHFNKINGFIHRDMGHNTDERQTDFRL